MRFASRNCFRSTEHPIHADVEGDTTYVCGGNRRGDRMIRSAESLAGLVDELSSASQPLGTYEAPCPTTDAYGPPVVDHIAPSVRSRNGVRTSRCFACGIVLVD